MSASSTSNLMARLEGWQGASKPRISHGPGDRLDDTASQENEEKHCCAWGTLV